VVVANTGLPDAAGLEPAITTPMRTLLASTPVVDIDELGTRFTDKRGTPGFFYWIRYAAEHPDFRMSRLMQATAGGLSDRVAQAYDAPFPDDRYMAGARRFPSLVPIFPDDPELPAQRRAWEVLRRFDKPWLTAFADNDPVTAGGHERFQTEVPGAQGQRHTTIVDAGHFLQEDQPGALANTVIRFMQDNPIAAH